jgi:hypothetical protein
MWPALLHCSDTFPKKVHHDLEKVKPPATSGPAKLG